jgi:hypothetical protein
MPLPWYGGGMWLSDCPERTHRADAVCTLCSPYGYSRSSALLSFGIGLLLATACWLLKTTKVERPYLGFVITAGVHQA